MSTFRKRMSENNKRGSVAAALIKEALADPELLEMSRLVPERRSACFTEMYSRTINLMESEEAARVAYTDAVVAHEATGRAMSSRLSDYEFEKVKVERHRE